MSLSLPEQASTTFSLEDRADHWRITGVPYRGNICPVDLLKTLLDGGAAKTQDEWVGYSREAQRQGAFHGADLLLYHALFATLYNHRDHLQHRENIEAVRAFLGDRFLGRWPLTLTRIRYTPSGKDQVIHNYGLQGTYEVLENIVGPDEYVENAVNRKPYQVLLGTDNLAEIRAVYRWITGKDTRLLRFHTRPKQVVERVARFDAGSRRALLFCCSEDPQGSGASLGVRFPSAVGAQKIEAQNIETYTSQQIATALQTLRLSGLEQQLLEVLKEQRR